ncbi:FAD-dependent oxidoreductase [Nonomuraea sp. CA-143628]|uniref:FAD-dependent oxidoreductase n=1 Tax=Nonomuraea sp. CA-143628 TaxID=3239997 RepID=UPI003D93D2A4
MRADICVYGGTPAGCVAAITAHQEGASVILVEPGRWLGGMLGSGIKPLQDCPVPEAVGGLTSDVIFRFGNHPPDIVRKFHEWVAEAGITVIFEHRIVAVTRNGDHIDTIHVAPAPPDAWGVPAPAAESGEPCDISASVFVDASYEGDLMALAGVPYRTGRESRQAFGETPAGVGQITNWTPIDPYVVPGDSTSKLLPLIDDDHGLPIGSADGYTQAYNFRFYLTTDIRNKAEITAPDDYSPDTFELVRRYVEHIKSVSRSSGDQLDRLRDIFPGWLNSGEYNYQRASLVTNAPVGVSHDYQDGDWNVRSRIWRYHIDYLRGLHHFLSTHPEVPGEFRQETAAYGLDASVFPETGGWPHQLYVRVSRRLKGEYTLTHADVLNQTEPSDAIGLALFGVDVYPARRIAHRDPETARLGVATEGDMFIGGHMGTGQPYPVPYRAITPRKSDCENLLVPVCLSATHIAYAATRMEPVFCVLAESAAVAATLSLRDHVAVQDIDIEQLRKRIAERGQIITWSQPSKGAPSDGAPKPGFSS